jgi:L-ascorbate metabolism protein UlaG (beta-lactamase superfamily)
VLNLLATRFGWGEEKKNFVPVPLTRDELVKLRKPDWGANKPNHLRATWFGHASFLVETPVSDGAERGVRILLDPVFAEQMGPWARVGPKRFSPLPCELEDVPKTDLVLISHNHYDHLDIDVIKQLYENRTKDLHFFCGLNLKEWFISCGVSPDHVTELDWWDEVEVTIENIGTVKLACTPAQHASARTPSDRNHALWCSWIIQSQPASTAKSLYFAGDTGYRTITKEDLHKDISTVPHCPAFAEIGEKYGPLDLALLPIGCFLPRTFMSLVHCAPEDAVCIHNDVRSKKTIGMHYGTIRGQLSGQYEEVTLPPRRFEEKAREAGLKWGEEIGLCDIGETVAV